MAVNVFSLSSAVVSGSSDTNESEIVNNVKAFFPRYAAVENNAYYSISTANTPILHQLIAASPSA